MARRGMSLGLSDHASETLKRAFASNPLPQQAQVERIMEFLAAAPESFRLLITGPVPSDLRGEYVDRAIAFLETLRKPRPNGAVIMSENDHVAERSGPTPRRRSRESAA